MRDAIHSLMKKTSNYSKQSYQSPELSCNFCSKKASEVKKLVSGPNCYICNECNVLITEIIQESQNDSDKDDSKVDFDADFVRKEKTPKDIKEFLDTFVIGQDKPKEMLAVAAYSHYKRLHKPELKVKKSNVLLAGPTGSGKTYMISKLAQALNVPWVSVDTASITAAGFIGGNIEDCLIDLIEKAGDDLRRAEYGIVYLDEIDKIRTHKSNSTNELDVGGKSVQQRLLKIIEGCDVDLQGGSRDKKSKSEHKSINTTNILFIASGAFVGLKNYAQPMTQDFIEFGMIPEFLGRFQLKGSLAELTIKDMVKILTEPKDNVVESYTNWFESEGVKLVFSQESLESIAKKAMDSNVGARGLQGIIEVLLTPVLFKVPSMEPKPEAINITTEFVNGLAEVIMISKPKKVKKEKELLSNAA